jgi:hypothetical protein
MDGHLSASAEEEGAGGKDGGAADGAFVLTKAFF